MKCCLYICCITFRLHLSQLVGLSLLSMGCVLMSELRYLCFVKEDTERGLDQLHILQLSSPRVIVSLYADNFSHLYIVKCTAHELQWFGFLLRHGFIDTCSGSWLCWKLTRQKNSREIGSNTGLFGVKPSLKECEEWCGVTWFACWGHNASCILLLSHLVGWRGKAIQRVASLSLPRDRLSGDKHLSDVGWAADSKRDQKADSKREMLKVKKFASKNVEGRVLGDNIMSDENDGNESPSGGEYDITLPRSSSSTLDLEPGPSAREESL